MNNMINRQNKTADGLRSRLFDTLEALIDGTCTWEKVSNVCFISEQILNSAKLEFEIEIEREKVAKEKREFEKDQQIVANNQIIALTEKINVLTEGVIEVQHEEE